MTPPAGQSVGRSRAVSVVIPQRVLIEVAGDGEEFDHYDDGSVFRRGVERNRATERLETRHEQVLPPH